MSQVICQSGRKGWQQPLHEVYDHDFDQFRAYCESYGIHQRLGFKTPSQAWKANPLIQGSIDPSDLQVVK